MTLDEMIELGCLFQRLAVSEGAVLHETKSVCRVDQISNLALADFNRIAEFASALALSAEGTLAMFGSISGEVDLENDDVSRIENETISVRLMKREEEQAAFFITRTGFEAALCNAEFMLSARVIYVAEKFLPFTTRACVYLPWGGAVDQSPAEEIFDSPRRLVRDESYQLVPIDIRPWYLVSHDDDASGVFSAWKEAAVRNLIFCLPTEIRNSDASKQVVLKGARSVFVDVDLTESQASLFNIVTEAVRWVYDQRRDTETKFHLLNNYLALYWTENSKWPMGLAGTLGQALASAREAFSFHLQDDSKEALKSLSDLRKALQDEVARSQTATRDLLAALWRDAAIAGAAFALRSATSNSSVVKTASLVAAALLFVSLVTTVLSNWRFDILAKQARMQWRQRLYAFMSDTQWVELVSRPISRARSVYRASMVPVLFVYVLLIGTLLWIAYPTEVMSVVDPLLARLLEAWRWGGALWDGTPLTTIDPSLPPSTLID